MEVIGLGLNKTEKIIAITFLVLITFLILRKYYAKPKESGFAKIGPTSGNRVVCIPPKPYWNGFTCVDKLKKGSSAI